MSVFELDTVKARAGSAIVNGHIPVPMVVMMWMGQSRRVMGKLTISGRGGCNRIASNATDRIQGFLSFSCFAPVYFTWLQSRMNQARLVGSITSGRESSAQETR